MARWLQQRRRIGLAGGGWTWPWRPLLPVLISAAPATAAEGASRANSDPYTVYWNRSNPRFHAGAGDDHGGCTVEVSMSDYLDIYCRATGRSCLQLSSWSTTCCTWSMARATPPATTSSTASSAGSATCSQSPGAAQVLREVPALHALLAGLRVPPGATSITTSLPHHQCC